MRWINSSHKWSLKQLLLLQFVLLATLPLLFLSTLLINEFRLLQIVEHTQKQQAQTERAVSLLSFEFERMSIFLQQMAQDSSAVLAANSGIFAVNIRSNLAAVYQANTLSSAILLLDKSLWIVEASPTTALLLPMDPLKPVLTELLEQDYLAQPATKVMLYPGLRDFFPEMPAQATEEILLMLAPLTLTDTLQPDSRSRLTGLLASVIPLYKVQEYLQHALPEATLEKLYWPPLRLESTDETGQYLYTRAELTVPWLADTVTVKFFTEKEQAMQAITALTHRLYILSAMVLLFVLSGGAWLIRRQIKPLNQLGQVLHAYAQGDLQQARVDFSLQEFDKIAAVLYQMACNVREQQSLLESNVQQRTHQLSAAVADLHNTNKQLVQTQQHLLDAERQAQMAQLMAGVSREIGQPVSRSIELVSDVINRVSVLTQAVVNQALKRSALEGFCRDSATELAELEQQLCSAKGLVNSFRTVALEQGNEPKSNFNLYDELHNIVLSMRFELQSHDVVLEVSGDKVMIVQSCPRILSQIMQQLMLNSLQHAIKDRQQLSIKISFRLTEKGLVELLYQDSGCGIAPSQYTQVFEAFYTTAREEGHIGLGLTIVSSLVRQKLSGAIRLNTPAAAGVEFVLTLPMRVVIKPRREAG